MLMGVRLYSPQSGLFTSVDPVLGGNANRYTYPGDPINSFDLDGKRRCREGSKKWYCRAWGWAKEDWGRCVVCYARHRLGHMSDRDRAAFTVRAQQRAERGGR